MGQQVLYIDASAGLSGDMLLAGMLDLGLPLRELLSACRRLGLRGVTVHLKRLRREGGWATQVAIHSSSLGKAPVPAGQWLSLLRRFPLGAALKRKILQVGEKIIQTESLVHQVDRPHLFLHQVGKPDTLVSLCGFCLGLLYWRIRTVFVSKIPIGAWHMDERQSPHDEPGPATQAMLRSFKTELRREAFEWTTPTGAALVATFGKQSPYPTFRVCSIGRAVGNGRPPYPPTVLRLVLAKVL